MNWLDRRPGRCGGKPQASARYAEACRATATVLELEGLVDDATALRLEAARVEQLPAPDTTETLGQVPA